MSAWGRLSLLVAFAASFAQAADSMTTVKAVGQVNFTVNAAKLDEFKTSNLVTTAFSTAFAASLRDVVAGDVHVTSVEEVSKLDANMLIKYEITSTTRIISLILADISGVGARGLKSKLVKEFETNGFDYSEPFEIVGILDGNIGSNTGNASAGTSDTNVNAFATPLSGVHKIENVRSKKIVTMEAMSKDDGGRLIQCTDHSAAAQWKFELQEHNIYTITNVLSGKLVTVHLNSKANGVLLHQWSNPKTSRASRWAVYEVEKGIYVLANINSNKLMSVTMNSIESNVGLNQWANEITKTSSQWKITADDSPPENVTVHVHAGELCMDAHPDNDQNINSASSLNVFLFLKFLAGFFVCGMHFA